MAQYATDENLQKRIEIHRYNPDGTRWADWYFSQVTFGKSARILDIGCGNAHLWSGREQRIPPEMAIVLTDTS